MSQVSASRAALRRMCTAQADRVSQNAAGNNAAATDGQSGDHGQTGSGFGLLPRLHAQNARWMEVLREMRTKTTREILMARYARQAEVEALREEVDRLRSAIARHRADHFLRPPMRDRNLWEVLDA